MRPRPESAQEPPVSATDLLSPGQGIPFLSELLEITGNPTVTANSLSQPAQRSIGVSNEPEGLRQDIVHQDVCMLCLSLDVEAHEDSETCIATQLRTFCHTCEGHHCWRSSRFCGKASRLPENEASRCAFCFSYGIDTFPKSAWCLETQHKRGYQCTRELHFCFDDAKDGCTSCSKTCHQDNSSPLCEFQSRA